MTGPSFTSEETSRYARHLVLPEIGGTGQQKLKAASVLVVGAGGLGAAVLQYLSAAGVGNISVVDDDRVSLSNLQRQVIHDTETVGMLKVESAAYAMARLNPNVAITTHPVRIDNGNVSNIIADHTVVVDGCDNFETRYLVAETCAKLKVPLVTAALSRFDGSITVLKPWENNNPSYRDLFPKPPMSGTVPTCAEVGILGAMVGILGSLQALETIKLITGAGDPLIGRLLMVDGFSMRMETVEYGRIVP